MAWLETIYKHFSWISYLKILLYFKKGDFLDLVAKVQREGGPKLKLGKATVGKGGKEPTIGFLPESKLENYSFDS